MTEATAPLAPMPAAPKVLVAAVAGAKDALGWLSAILEDIGGLVEASCQVRASYMIFCCGNYSTGSSP